MQELIKVTADAQGAKVVSARDLHEFLSIKARFNDWINNRINKYGFIENQDFVTFTKILVSGGREIEYALTLDTAKELAMVEGNAKGKQARQYFIECEKQLKQTPQLSTIDLIIQSAQAIKEQEQRTTVLENKVLQLEAKTTTTPDYFTVVGYAIGSHVKIGLQMAAKIGAKAKAICKQEGIPVESIPDPRFGKVGMYPRSVLEQAFQSVQF